MWGRRRKPKRGGQLERQLALGRLVDALAEVDKAQDEATDDGTQVDQVDERQHEETRHEDTEPEQTGQRTRQQRTGERREPEARGEPPSAAAEDSSEVSSRRTRHRSFGLKRFPVRTEI